VHEYAIAEGVIAVATHHAAGRRVAAIDLRVGHLRQVVRSALEFAFEIASQGTPAEGAELRLTAVAPVVLCGVCGRETEALELPLACRECGGFDVAVLAGEELEVESIEVFNDEEAPVAEQEVA
jgi:hydrogenase nickel incorporation protein HypA/HybF